MAVQKGCLLLADITGYSSYLAGVELEHSHDILADLLSVVIEQLTGQLALAKLEGDAVFCYAPVGDDVPGGPATLVTMVESTYFSFQRRLRDIERATTCTCDACRRIPQLTLKFLVHHGAFVIHEVVGNRELVGPDVVLAHRLLKNSITQRTGLRGYALFSRACIERFAIDPAALEMTDHREVYEDVGEVHGFVHDLERRWREETERQAVYLGPGQALFEFEADLPGPPPVVWEWMTSPTRRLLWQLGVTGVEQDNPRGVPGVGTTNHCVHGADAVVEHIVDWRPFRYVTDRTEADWGEAMSTIELIPIDEGTTRMAFRFEPLVPEEMRETVRQQMGPMLDQMFEHGLEVIRAHLSGSVPTPSPSA